MRKTIAEALKNARDAIAAQTGVLCEVAATVPPDVFDDVCDEIAASYICERPRGLLRNQPPGARLCVGRVAFLVRGER